MSESSELLMQCDEEDLDPWQQVDDDARSERNKLNASKTTKCEFASKNRKVVPVYC